MIKIIHDPEDLISAVEINRIDSQDEFPRFVDAVLQALANQQNYTLVLRQNQILQWFKQMATRYPQGAFSFEVIDAREALARRLGLSIPVQVSNADILETGLLAADLQPQPGLSFEDLLLKHFFSPHLIARTLPTVQLVDLLTAINPNQWKENLRIPLLARTLNNRLEAWKDKARTSEQRELIDQLARDPRQLRQELMMFRALQSYPALGDALMGAAFTRLSFLRLPLEDLDVDETQVKDAINQVTYHLNQQKPQDVQALTMLIGGMSGLLSVEFDLVEKWLIEQAEIISPDQTEERWINEALIDMIEQKFASQSRRLARRIGALRSMIRPPKPTDPNMGWDADTMLAWAIDSYLPYQAWCDKQAQFDLELFQIGDRFSEWLIAHWHQLQVQSKRMVFNILPNKAAEFKQRDVVNLILVIDNLGWSNVEVLRDLFQAQGYFLASAEPYLAMVPSETEISKKCLLAGAVGYQAIDNTNYQKIIEKGWVPYFNDHAFKYIPDIGGLKLVQSIDASTYVVNYLAVDRAFHKSSNEIGMPHRDHVAHLLEKLVESCAAFIDQHQLKERIKVHIVSDHGSTRIPEAFQNDLETDFFKSDDFEKLSHRYVKVKQERFENLADNLRHDCFFLPANDYSLPNNYLCARRANRFLATDDDFYVHGGLLPEEMIVPHCIFEPVSGSITELTLLIKKAEFRYRLETIEVELGNPNDTAVEQIQLIIVNGNVESEPQKVSWLGGKTKASLKFEARFRPTHLEEEQTQLRFRIRFHARGEQHSFDHQVGIKMRKLVEEKSSGIFDD